jgi:hypothetical protein
MRRRSGAIKDYNADAGVSWQAENCTPKVVAICEASDLEVNSSDGEKCRWEMSMREEEVFSIARLSEVYDVLDPSLFCVVNLSCTHEQG